MLAASTVPAGKSDRMYLKSLPIRRAMTGKMRAARFLAVKGSHGCCVAGEGALRTAEQDAVVVDVGAKIEQ